jgi:hypothetical protein
MTAEKKEIQLFRMANMFVRMKKSKNERKVKPYEKPEVIWGRLPPDCRWLR